MNRREAEAYIRNTYGTEPEYPWASSPLHAVFRHAENRKWFAIIMCVSADKLGLNSKEMTDVMNVKCDQNMIGSFLLEQGFYPAYHMNKLHWISIALDGSAADDTVRQLIDMSFLQTAEKPRKKTSRTESRTERIIRMEQYFDALSHAAQEDIESVWKDAALCSMLEKLEFYYENGQWREDFEADERGELPSEFKRGVLSEDGVYDLLAEIAEAKRE